MKFGHEFQEALKREGYPDRWVESAIAYGRLKKCIKKVEGELLNLGLNAETLKRILHPEPGQVLDRKDSVGSEGIAYQYTFAGASKNPRPRLTFVIDTKNGMAIDAHLSPSTREYLEKLASKPHQPHPL